VGAGGGAGGSAAAISLCGESGGRGHFASPSEGQPEHPLPGYGAGYDAGFLAGLLAASQGDAPPHSRPPPGPGPVADKGGAGAPEPARPPFLAQLEDFPDLFQKEVLERLDPLDLALLGRTGSAIRAAVVGSVMPRVGGSAEEPRVDIEPFCHSLSMFIWAVANGCPWQLATTCETLAQGGHLEVLKWARAREHGCPWDEKSCESAALEGQLQVLQGCRSTTARGTGGHVRMPRGAGTWRSCSGRGSTGARGMRTSTTGT